MRRQRCGHDDLTLSLEKFGNGRTETCKSRNRTVNILYSLNDVQCASHIHFLGVPPSCEIVLPEFCDDNIRSTLVALQLKGHTSHRCHIDKLVSQH